MKKWLHLAGAFLASLSMTAQDCDCLVDLDSTFQVVPFSVGTPPDFRNDDAFSPPIALPFTFNLYGTEHTECYINNNGNISFGNGYSTFTASGFPINQFPMIAAFWADVDTRNPESGLVYYKVTEHALIVRYNEVGYFPNMADLKNDFQVIISDGQSDLIPDGHNIGFCYGDMQWTSGSASGGSGGFGSNGANVGANAGDGVSAMQIGRFNQSGDIYDGPYGNPDGVDFIDDSHLYFTTNPVDENQYPVNVSSYCDTIFGAAGDTLAFFYFDDVNQDLVIDLIDSSGYFSGIDSTGGMVLYNGHVYLRRDNEERVLGDDGMMVLVSPTIPNGAYDIYITATDNGMPALTTTSRYTVQIGPNTPTSVSTLSRSTQPVAYLNNGMLEFKGIESNKVREVNVFNGAGQRVMTSNRLMPGIDTNYWQKGLYIYTIRCEREVFTGKIIIE